VRYNSRTHGIWALCRFAWAAFFLGGGGGGGGYRGVVEDEEEIRKIQEDT